MYLCVYDAHGLVHKLFLIYLAIIDCKQVTIDYNWSFWPSMKVHPNVSMTKSGRHTIVFVVPDKLYRICCCKNIACFSFGYANVFLPCFFTCITLLVALSMPFSPCYHVTIYHVHHVTIYLVLPSRVHQGRQGVPS